MITIRDVKMNKVEVAVEEATMYLDWAMRQPETSGFREVARKDLQEALLAYDLVAWAVPSAWDLEEYETYFDASMALDHLEYIEWFSKNFNMDVAFKDDVLEPAETWSHDE